MMRITSYHFSFGIILLSFFLLACLACMAATNIATDQVALLALKGHMITSEPHQILANNWSVTSYVCDWRGVTCSFRHPRVTALNISNMGLTGTVPPQLGNLSFLVSLDLSGNNFHGELPRDLANLHQLRVLDVGVNNISGELPSWFDSLQKLQHLCLKNNSFTGSIPSSIFNISNLETLNLSYNLIQGTIPIEIGNGNPLKLKKLNMNFNQLSGPVPSVLFNISSLAIIAFQSNSLSGNLPANICHRLQRLTWLDLSANKLSGQIPATLFQCSELRVLGLSYNDFRGTIPKEIGNLTVLEELYLGSNSLTGAIPNEVGNLTSLMFLNLFGNNLTGLIPKDVGSLYRLQLLNLYKNRLSGSIPGEIFNISALEDLDLSFNNLSGTLPSSMGYKLSNLGILRLEQNYLNGVIPNSISNASELTILSLNVNGFTGPIPDSLGNLRNLTFLDLSYNRLSSESGFPELSFITSLMSCRFLRYLLVIGNPLNGFLPTLTPNHSTSLEFLSASSSKIFGNIPNEIGNLSSLLTLDLSHNELIGSIPKTIQGLTNLQGILLQFNQIREPLDIICGLHSLSLVDLSHNKFYGPIPECLGNITSLSDIHLAYNILTSGVPASLWNMKNLQVLNFSTNFLTGSLPLEIGNLKAAYSFDLSINQLSGSIPTTIGELQNLLYLSLANNRLQGSIPQLTGNMLSLEFLNLSHNNLSGVIPKSLEALLFLKDFNVSYNRLSGEIPHGGPFGNFTRQSFMYNEALCGDPRFDVQPCHSNPRKRNLLQLGLALLGIAAIVVAMTLAILSLRRKKKQRVSSGTDLFFEGTYGRFSYRELLQSTDGYSESNLLGIGSFGSVYKGSLNDGTLVAIKVFNLQLEGEFKSYDTECEVLRNLRHRNLTKVIGDCSNLDFKALVLQYMPNGNLEKWLYSSNHFLDLIQRVNIMIDVACALEYLHFGYPTPVVHCDLKPSNILLDEDMVAHVSDFGVAKMLGEGESTLLTKTLVTLGYIAPEYGLEGLVSTKADVYSFGILLMETFSRMKPSDEMFSGDLSLKRWIEDSLPNATLQVVDSNIIEPENEYFTDKLECISLIFKLAVNCCRESPGERISMKDVVADLTKIKHQLLIIQIGKASLDHK